MSEEAKDSGEVKKKGKLPVMLVLALLIGGGGFFGLKSKGGAPKRPEVKAGIIAPVDKEFLINLKGKNEYLRVEVALELRDGYKKEDLDANMQAARDTIIQIFRAKSIDEVGPSHTEDLKKEIAESINEILISHMKEEEKKTQEDFEKSTEPSKSDEKKSKNGKETDQSDDSKSSDNKDWVCPAGPVLNVQFTNFTTQ